MRSLLSGIFAAQSISYAHTVKLFLKYNQKITMNDNDYAAQRHSAVQARINSAATEAGRPPHEVALVGAAKQQSTERVNAFVDAGLNHIGHNYLQEAIVMKERLPDQLAEWHYIGQIQSNKTALIAQHFDWVHSVDRFKIAKRLAQQCPPGKQIQTLIQINIDDEASKAGIKTHEAADICVQISELPNLKLRGFMVIPKAREDASQQRKPFAAARQLLAHCNQQHKLGLDTLSMGMSSDLEAAIAEGSTMVRIGSDLFGARN